MRFAIYGVGGFGREVAPIAKAVSQDVVFVDDGADRPSHCNGIPVLSFEDLTSEQHRDRQVVVAVGSGKTRQKIEQKCEAAGIAIGTLISPVAHSLDCNTVGAGAVLCHNVILTANARIGRSFQANIYSYVAHDCVVGDYVTFAPRVNCNGNVHIGDFAYIGTAASLIQGTRDEPLTIGEGAIVGMGAVVTKPVPAYTLVAGNPARAIRTLEQP